MRCVWGAGPRLTHPLLARSGHRYLEVVQTIGPKRQSAMSRSGLLQLSNMGTRRRHRRRDLRPARDSEALAIVQRLVVGDEARAIPAQFAGSDTSGLDEERKLADASDTLLLPPSNAIRPTTMLRASHSSLGRYKGPAIGKATTRSPGGGPAGAAAPFWIRPKRLEARACLRRVLTGGSARCPTSLCSCWRASVEAAQVASSARWSCRRCRFPRLTAVPTSVPQPTSGVGLVPC